MTNQQFGKRTIGDCTLYLGDCLELISTLQVVDCVVSDPPYSSGGMVRGDRMASTRNKYQSTSVDVEHPEFTGDNRDQRGFHAWAALWLLQALSITKPGGVLVLFSDWRQLPTMTDAIQSGGWIWRGIVPWNKINSRPQPNRFRAQCEYAVWGSNGPRDFSTLDASYHPGILTESPPTNGQRQHTTQKPVGIMAELCKIAPLGGTVLDPFMGSGTTAIACIDIGRKFIGIEKDPGYFDLACRRIEEHYQKQCIPA